MLSTDHWLTARFLLAVECNKHSNSQVKIKIQGFVRNQSARVNAVFLLLANLKGFLTG